MRIRLTVAAEAQLKALPATAARRVLVALRVLGSVPSSGRRFPPDSPFAGSFYKTVVVRVRRWTYRVIYDVDPTTVWIRFIVPSSFPLTHSALASGES